MIVFAIIFCVVNAFACLLRIIEGATSSRMRDGELVFTICFNSVMMVSSIVLCVLFCMHR